MAGKSITMFVDKANGVYVPEDKSLFDFIIQDFEQGEKVTVTFERFVRPRSLNQNGLFYKYIQMISDYTGQDKEDIKKEMKKQFGIRNDHGMLKSTRDYTSAEMTKLIDGTRIFGIQELGIDMPTPDDLKNNNIK